jgi:hypothetical protein
MARTRATGGGGLRICRNWSDLRVSTEGITRISNHWRAERESGGQVPTYFGKAHEIPVKRALLVLAIVAVAVPVAAGAVGAGPLSPAFHRPIPVAAGGGVVGVEIRPIPEGPPSKGVALDQLIPYVPDPLPAPLFQWFCSTGGSLTVNLGDGTEVTYGPCFRPASINRLWARLVYVATDGACAPSCGPNGEPAP